MSHLQDLRERVANIVTESRSKLDEITDDTPAERAAEIEAEVDKMLGDVADLEKKIERQEKIDAVERRAKEAADREEQERRAGRRPSGNGQADGNDGDGKMTYRDAFHAWLRSNLPNADPLSVEARQILRAGYHEVKFEQRAQTTADTAGGYTIPEEMRPELIKSMLMWGPMYDPGVTGEITTAGGNPMPFPTVDDTGSTAEPHTEGATLTDDGGKDVTFGEKQLDAYAFDTEWIRVSLELATDSAFAMESVLRDLLGERLGRIANLQLTTGTGSGAPNGIVTASGLGKTAAAAAAITFDEIIDLEHSVDPAYRQSPRCAYMMNDNTLLAVRKLKDGQGNYLWQQGDVKGGVPNTVNGRPYRINQAMANIGASAKPMLFGDLGKYWVRKLRGMPLIGAIQDKDFWPGFGIAGYIRFDGELTDVAAVKHMANAAS